LQHKPKSPSAPTTGATIAHPASRSSSHIGWHIGHIALLIGALSVLILLLMTASFTGGPLKLAAVLFAATGAFGVYRCSSELELTPLPLILLTALALIPVVGSFVCMLVLKWVMQRRFGF
jgi:hypothetical protein